MNDLSLYRCLASPTRLAILKHLAQQGEDHVGALADAVGTDTTNVSHQLRDLRACGLVVSRQEGKRVLCRLGHESLRDLLHAADELARHIAVTDACRDAGCC